jgi:hypothetical protein
MAKWLACWAAVRQPRVRFPPGTPPSDQQEENYLPRCRSHLPSLGRKNTQQENIPRKNNVQSYLYSLLPTLALSCLFSLESLASHSLTEGGMFSSIPLSGSSPSSPLSSELLCPSYLYSLLPTLALSCLFSLESLASRSLTEGGMFSSIPLSGSSPSSPLYSELL